MSDSPAPIAQAATSEIRQCVDEAIMLVKQRGVANQVTDRLRQIAEAGHHIEEIAQVE